MSDLVSRQEVIEVIDAVMPVNPNKSEYASGIACGAALAMTYVKQLPSAQPESKWISVNDKLPEEGSPVLLLYINEEIGFSESCRPKTWNQLTDNTIVGWFPIPKETKING